jgi:predicted ATPase
MAEGTGLDHLRTLSPDEWGHLERAVDRFVTAWRVGDRPAIADYLPADVGLRPPALVELVHTDLELRLKAGEAARVEEYLRAFAELATLPGAAVDLIVAEYGLRSRSEPALAMDEYLRRFPDLADELGSRLRPPSTAVPGSGAGTATRMDPVPVVPGYEILEVLGRGGMGVVYKARQLSLDRPVALKFLPAATAGDPAWLDRFRREGRTASALNHPHICTIYDTGDAAGRPYLSMEWIEGRTLHQGPRPPIATAVRWIYQAARALAAAHAAGVVHRDVKPDNLMVRSDGIVKVLDFGLARQLTGGSEAGGLVGTLQYMSPEQAREELVGPACDVFSLGLVLYELTTGRHPFAAAMGVTVLHAIANEPVVPPSRLNPEIPAGLETLILRMLEKDPAARPTAAEVAASLTEPEARPARRPTALPGLHVGRDEQRAALLAAFDSVAGGQGRFVCVTGEAGLGKTSVVEDFLNDLAGRNDRYGVARGRCSERLAGAEAYLPILEALGSLLRGPAGPAMAGIMKFAASSWYEQLAPLGDTRPNARGASQERLKRELAGFLEEATRTQPLVLFLEDIHWADPSSVDLLAYLGTRTAGLSILVVLTYRAADLARSNHPFGPIKLELQGRGVLREIALPYLGRSDIDAYLDLTFPGHQFPDEFVDLVLARTGGNALFLVDLLRYLTERGAIVEGTLKKPLADIQGDLPESIRGMIRREMDTLDAADRELLSAASVQGMEFDSAVVATVLGRSPVDVEDRLDALDRVHAKVQLLREHEFPDGTLTLRYRFLHVLYQNALYAAVRPTRRATWSAAAAQALLTHHRNYPGAVASELALLFEAARDPAQAIEYFLAAARNAVRLSAHPEAVTLARRGLALLPRLPDTPARAQRELDLLLALGVSLVVTRGFAAPEVEEAFSRARALIRAPEDIVARFPVLYGLWNVYLLRADLVRCMDLAAELFAAGLGHPDPVIVLQAHNVLQQPLLHLGDFAAARRHQREAFARYDVRLHYSLTAEYSEDPGVGCLLYAAVTLWCQGYPDQAAAAVRDARALADRLPYPFDRARALYFGAFMHLCAREVGRTRELAAVLHELSREQGYPLHTAGSSFFLGWCSAKTGDRRGGIERMRQAQADWRATGAVSHRPYQLALLAEALAEDGRPQEALPVIEEARALTEATGERFLEADVHRVRGDILAASDADAASACYRQAVEVAQRQGARSLELRALLGRYRLDRERGASANARRALAEAFDRFTEGFDSPDLVEARELLTTS